MIHEDITDKILKAFYIVYNELGTGFLESVYRNAMYILLKEMELKCDAEIPIAVWFRGQKVGDFRADLLVEKAVIVELKACKAIDASHIAQTIHYLRATGIEVGLLLNFGPKPEFKRLVKTVNPCLSA
jgi:GxxExxY protein